MHTVGEPAEGSLSINTLASAKRISIKPRAASLPRDHGLSAVVRKVVIGAFDYLVDRAGRLPGRRCCAPLSPRAKGGNPA